MSILCFLVLFVLSVVAHVLPVWLLAPVAILVFVDETASKRRQQQRVLREHGLKRLQIGRDRIYVQVRDDERY